MNRILDLSKPVVVTMESFQHLKDAKLVNDDGSILDISLIVLDEISRNQTYYGSMGFMKSLDNSTQVQEKIENKTWMGEAEHPKAPDGGKPKLERLMFVEPTRWVWRIDNYYLESNILRGVVQWCNNELGNMYKDLVVNHGSNLGASVRSYTPNYIQKKDSFGKEYVEKTYPLYIATFDCVTIPGLRGSRIMDPDKYKMLSQNDNITPKLVGVEEFTTKTFEEVCYSNVVAELRDCLRSEEGMSFISDAYKIDIDKADMIINGRNSVSISLENDLKLDVPLDNTIISKIMGK